MSDDAELFTLPSPVSGSLAASGQSATLDPVQGVPVWLTLSGTWTGTVQLQRSVDAGATWQDLTLGGAAWARFTANACEPVHVESEGEARLRLDFTRTSGTLTYRLAQ